MKVAGYECVILRRGSSWQPDGFMDDSIFAEQLQCSACDDPLGLNVPIVVDEGELTRHLSCAIAWEIAREGWRPGGSRSGWIWYDKTGRPFKIESHPLSLYKLQQVRDEDVRNYGKGADD